MSNEKHTSGPEKDIHSQRPRFLDPDAREKAELGYFLNEEEEPVEVELIGAPTEFMDEDYGIPRPIDLDDPPKPKSSVKVRRPEDVEIGESIEPKAIPEAEKSNTAKTEKPEPSQTVASKPDQPKKPEASQTAAAKPDQPEKTNSEQIASHKDAKPDRPKQEGAQADGKSGAEKSKKSEASQTVAVKPDQPEKTNSEQTASHKDVKPDRSKQEGAQADGKSGAEKSKKTGAAQTAAAKPVQAEKQKTEAPASRKEDAKKPKTDTPKTDSEPAEIPEKGNASQKQQKAAAKKQPKGKKQVKKNQDFSDTRKIEAIKQAQKKYQQEVKEASGEKGLPPEDKKRKKKGGKSHWVRSIVLVVIMLVISGLLASFILFGLNDIYAVAKPSRVISVEVPKGAHSAEISDLLGKNGVVDLPWLFRLVTKLRDDSTEFQYGTYTLNSNIDYDTIIETLKKNPNPGEGEGIVRLTFPEGQTLDAYAALLEKEGVCSAQEFLDAINLKVYSLPMEEHLLDVDTSLKYYRMEGYAFPDTYDFYKNENPESVARKFLANLDSKLTDPMYGQMDQQGLTLDETIALASIVQAEAGSQEDMPIIASVLLNRIKSQGAYPKLQSDPTTKYANELQIKLSEQNKPYEEVVKAYDTYQGDGIPPGAICNPGLDAINAVLNPASTNYYYFCANTVTKECFYATTLEEHNKNLEKAGLK